MKTLTATLVAEIRQRSRSGTVTAAALASEYGVSRCAISNAAWVISFAHVPWDGPPQWKYPVGGAARAKLTKHNAQAIRAAYTQGGTTVRKLAAQYEVGKSTIHHVLQGESWGGHSYDADAVQKARNYRANRTKVRKVS